MSGVNPGPSDSNLAQLLLRERLARVKLLEAEVQHKLVETQRMQEGTVLSLEREEHLIKDMQISMWLHANLIHCLQDASWKMRLLVDVTEEESCDPDKFHATKQAKAGHRK